MNENGGSELERFISEVRVILWSPGQSRIRGTAQIRLADNNFVLRGVKIIQGNDGLSVAMPSRKTPQGTYEDIFHRATAEGHQVIEKTVLAAYWKAVRNRRRGDDPPPVGAPT